MTRSRRPHRGRSAGRRPPAVAALRSVIAGRLARRAMRRSRPADCVAPRPVGRARRRSTWRCSRRQRTSRSLSLACPGRRFPSVGAHPRPGDPARARHRRPLRPRPARRDRYAPLARPWPLGRSRIRSARRGPKIAVDPAAALCPFLPVEGRGPAPDPGRPGPCRHHRARPFPLHRQRRDGRAARGAARLRPQGHRRPDGRRRHRPPRRGSPAAPPATRPSPMPRLRPRRRGGARRSSRRRAPIWLRAADGRTRAPRQSLRRHRRDLQRRRLRADARPLRRAARARAALRRRRLRPSPDDGPDRARRRRGRPWRRTRRAALARSLAEIRRAFPAAGRALRRTASLQDRTVGTGILQPELAARFAPGGYVGRGVRPRLRRPPRRCPIRPTTRWPSTCRCSPRATSTRASGSASARSSRAWR